jgi:glycerate 2-kinase
VSRRAEPTPVIAVVGRNDLKPDTGPFDEVHAVADLADTDATDDSRRTAILLERIGYDIGRRLIRA